MTTSVGSVSLDFYANTQALDRAMLDIQQRALESAKFIESQFGRNMLFLKPVVDDSALTLLNKHLDLKQKHFKEVDGYIRSHPLTPKVDARNLDVLDQKLKDIQFQAKRNILITTKVSSNVKSNATQLELKIDTDKLERSFANATDALKTEMSSVGDDIGKSVSKGIKKATPKKSGFSFITDAVLSAPKNIVRGFYEGIGITYADQLTRGFIRGVEGKFQTSVRRIGENTSKSFLNAGERVGDRFLQRLGIADGFKGLKPIIDNVNRDLLEIVPVDEIEKRLSKLEKRIAKFVDDLTRLKPAKNNIQNLVNVGKAAGDVAGVPAQGLKKRRERIIRETASRIKKEYSGAESSSHEISPDAEYITLVSGGFAGSGGKSSSMVAKKLGVLLGDKHHLVPIENTATDVSASIQELGVTRWLAEAGGKIASHNAIDGINPDAVKMAQKAYELHKQNPDKQIRFAGFSAGGFVAHDAMEIAKAMGVPAKAIAIGTPHWGKMSSLGGQDYQAVVRELDGVNKIANAMAPLVGGMSASKVQYTPGKDHDISLYLSEPEAQAAIKKQLEGKSEVNDNLLTPEAFRVVSHKSDAEDLMASLEYQLVNPFKDPNVQKQLLGQTLQGIEEVKGNLRSSLPHLAAELQSELHEYINALNEASDLIKSMLPVAKKPSSLHSGGTGVGREPIAPKTDANSQYSPEGSSSKEKEELASLMLTLNKKDVLEPIAAEFGLKNVRNTKKVELIDQLLAKADPKVLRKTLPYSTPPSEEVVREVEKRATTDTPRLKSILDSSKNSIGHSIAQNPGSKSARQMSDISQAIEKEYQIVITMLSKGIGGDAKKLLEGAKLDLAKLRAKIIRESSEQLKREISRGKNTALSNNHHQEVRIDGLARVPTAGTNTSFLQKVFTNISSKYNSIFSSFNKNSAHQIQRNYEAIIREAARVSKVHLKSGDVPKLVVDEARLKAIGAKAFYSIKQNQIIIDKELEKILRSSPQKLKQFTEQLKSITHEARHAFQFDFGRKGLLGLTLGQQAGVNLIPFQHLSRGALYNAERSAQVAQKQNKGLLPKPFLDIIRRTEADAYGFEEIFTEKIVENAVDGLARVKSPSRNHTSPGSQSNNAISSLSQFIALASKGTITLNNLSGSFIALLKSTASSLPGGGFLSGLIDAADSAKGAILPLLTAFLSFKAVSFLFKTIGASSIEAATSFEGLARRIEFASGSAVKGAKNLAAVRSESRRLNIDLKQSYQSAAGLFASTKDTPLEGEPTRQILSAVNQATAVYSLDPQQQERVSLAVGQMAGKGVVSAEELRQQLGESLPGAFNIAARAMGVTTQQLNKMLERGEILSENFLPKFAQQLSAETAGGVAGAAASSAAAVNNLNNSLFEAQVSVGKILLPLRNLGLNAASGAMEGLANNAGLMARILQFTALVAVVKLGDALFKLLGFGNILSGIGQSIGLLGKYVLNPIAALTQLNTGVLGLINTLKPLAPLAAQFLLFNIGVEIFEKLKFSFSDAGGAIRDFVSQSKKGLADYENALAAALDKQQQLSSSLPSRQKLEARSRQKDWRNSQLTNTFGIAGWVADTIKSPFQKPEVFGKQPGEKVSLTERVIAPFQRVGDVFKPTDVKILDDKIKAIDDLLNVVQTTIAESQGEKIADVINQVNLLDKRLEDIQLKRRVVLQQLPGDKAALRKLKVEEELILQQRSDKIKPVGTLQQQFQLEIDGLKKSLEELEQLKANGAIDADTYKSRYDSTSSSLEKAQRRSDEFNASIKSGVTNLQLLERSVTKVSDRLADALSLINVNLNKAKIAISLGEANGTVTPGQAQFQGIAVEQDALQRKIEETNTAIKEQRALLETEDNAKILQTYGVDINVVGAAELKTLSERATAPKEKLLFEKYAAIKQMEVETGDLEAQLARTKADTTKQLYDLNKQVTDYYRQIQRTAAEVALSAKEATNALALSNAKSKLKLALLGFQDNFITSFLESLVGILDQMNEPLQQAIEVQRQLLQNNNGLEDTIRQGTELGRHLPGSDSRATARSNNQPSTSIPNIVIDYTPNEHGLINPVPGSTRATNSRGYAEDSGLDIYAPVGTKVVAALSGILEYAETGHNRQSAQDSDPAAPGHQPSYSIRIKLDKPLSYNGSEYPYLYYTHLRDVESGIKDKGSMARNVKEPTRIEAGQTLGEVGVANKIAHLHMGVLGDRNQSKYLKYQDVDRLVYGSSGGKGGGIPLSGEGWGVNFGNPKVKEGYPLSNTGVKQGDVGSNLTEQQRFVIKVASVAKQIGADPLDLLTLMSFETAGTFSPKVQGPEVFDKRGRSLGRGRGLIQFMPATAKNLGSSDAQLASMTRIEQMDWVQKYLGQWSAAKFQGKGLKPLYASVFAGNPDARGSISDGYHTLDGAVDKMRREHGGRASAMLSNISSTGAIEDQGKSATVNDAISTAQKNTNVQNQIVVDRYKATKTTNVFDSTQQLDRAHKQLLSGFRDLTDGVLSSTRRVEDLDDTTSDTPNKQRAINIRNTNRAFDDFSKDLTRQREHIFNAVESAKSGIFTLEQGLADGTYPQQFKPRLTDLKILLPALLSQLSEIDAAIISQREKRGVALADIESKALTEEHGRQKNLSELLQQQEIELIRDAAQKAEIFQKRHPFDLSLGDPLMYNHLADTREEDLTHSRNNKGYFDSLRKGELRLSDVLQLVANEGKRYKLKQQINKDTYTQGIENKNIEKDDFIFGQRQRVFQSNQDLLSTKSSYLKTKGFNVQSQRLEKTAAIANQEFNYTSMVREIEKLVATNQISINKASELKSDLSAINAIKLDDIRAQFDVWNNVIVDSQSSFQNFLSGIISGTASIGEAFSGMVQSIANNLSQLAAQYVSNEIFKALIGGKSGFGTSNADLNIPGESKESSFNLSSLFTSSSDPTVSIAASTMKIFGLKDGGVVEAADHSDLRKGKNPIARALQKEGSRSVLAALTPGEMVLNLEQTRQYHQLGMDRVLNFREGGLVPGGGTMPNFKGGSGNPVTVNIPVSINSNGGANDSDMAKTAAGLGQVLKAAVMQEIQNQKRPGGLLQGI